MILEQILFECEEDFAMDKNAYTQVNFDISHTSPKLLARLLARQFAARWMRDPHTAFITTL